MSGAPETGERQLLSLLGIAARAGALVYGTGAVRQAVREGEAVAVVVAVDSSATQQQKLLPLLRRRGVPAVGVASQDTLGSAVGRGTLSAVGISEASFARRIVELGPPLSSL